MTNPSPQFEKIVGRALVDKNFRDLLYSDRAAALGGYQPSDEETEFLDKTSQPMMEACTKAGHTQYR